jgi:uncharacterized protein YjbI with pentapeptide repeats
MADENLLSLLQQGPAVWNRWRAERGDPVPVDLTGVDLRGRDLSGANLQGGDFTGASFREADLSNADLTDTRGWRAEQFAGADLTGAKLPEQLTKLYEDRENVKGISESARKLFLVVLGACLYCWLTIATTTDVNLSTNRNSSPLPIIQTSIPIVGFYVVGPILVLCVYFYFQFYLQKLWEELASLPAIFPDGRPLHTKVDPWLLNDLVRSHLPKLNADRPFLSYLQLWISVMLAWWVVPLTMVLFWGRYLRRHEPVGTMLHVALLSVSLVAGIALYRLAVATLKGASRMPFRWRNALRSRRGYQTVFSGVEGVILFGLVSWGAIWGVASGWSKDPHTWVPSAMALIDYHPFLNLRGADVSQKKPNWNRKTEMEIDQDSVIGAQLGGANLRYASAGGAFLADARLSVADLSGAELINADLTDAQLFGADLRGADLFGADLNGAHLIDADLRGANLFGADLRGANLFGADLRGADLSSAKLNGAKLNGADLNGADLRGAGLRGADLNSADLSYCDLRFTKNLSPQQVQSGQTWNGAYYDDAMLQALGLPPDHNEKLKEQQNKQTPLVD